MFRDHERWEQHTRPWSDLNQGTPVFILNQKGASKATKQWDRTGVVLEDEGNNKYMVKVDGSGRVVHMNRRYLRKFKTKESSQPTSNHHLQEPTTILNNRGMVDHISNGQSVPMEGGVRDNTATQPHEPLPETRAFEPPIT